MDIQIPADFWEEDVEGVISSWLYDDGDTVEKGDVIVEVMVEKVMHELEAPASGILKQLVAEEEPAAKGSVVGRIE
ncbi:lipoyl domain-containing protein [Kordiimonas pumila]|uniref:Lipoyl domain-containing protein n=1 Tax=Kordiimonas pumila TaxID=2161677 RepID=A0ABV7D8Z5_9PROT|nr:lipoyl domain-containing protein [Kordiimonas pumila]